ncbi:hypothetical protein [Cohnella thailandensis]|uniref:Uncharacterized protein n=1 Tax=Cohnella thailandensis TaxID=557557 RepID=A0A841SS64_9BACL|nr:hypothetical protein [Cohnella thailandensis]MBB6633436.1 hypothetical protein [Cohnella thailandensis]MBP1974450.1 hypothetical protein [Cohnella thailandensis]
MGSPSSAPAAMLALILVFMTGSAWFVALHPRLFWRMLGKEQSRAGGVRILRLAAFASGCIGFGLLLLPIL